MIQRELVSVILATVLNLQPALAYFESEVISSLVTKLHTQHPIAFGSTIINKDFNHALFLSSTFPQFQQFVTQRKSNVRIFLADNSCACHALDSAHHNLFIHPLF
ncbi:hypothetical protein AMECASPLE_035680 [Ameca splendens]|uniref:Uncharacterized protein n=1 Tax=Ameca splendens TaxID=208324 RepID=A0ABV1ADS9_9TELE